MDLIPALEQKIYDHFRDKIVEDEELHIRRVQGRILYLIVEFSVTWFDSLPKFHIYYEDGLLQLWRIDGPSERSQVARWYLEDPNSITGLLLKMEEEWSLFRTLKAMICRLE